jgi:excisionase family DNA binding protein
MRQVRLTTRVADLLTVEQAASVLGISVATLWRWRAQGDLDAQHVLGRTVFDRGKIEALAKRRRAG